MFVRVIIPIPSPKTFIYAVPEESAAFAAVGKRVVVPFGAKRLTGWIAELPYETSEIKNIKEIIAIPDAEPLFSGEDLVFFEWIASYYLHPLGMVLAEALPGGINQTSQNWIRLVPGAFNDAKTLNKTQEAMRGLL